MIRRFQGGDFLSARKFDLDFFLYCNEFRSVASNENYGECADVSYSAGEVFKRINLCL